jgi:histidinol-phosphate aminotransferase
VWCAHPQRPAKDLYEQLKAAHILVRYMNYRAWIDTLRISVGTDEQIEALLGRLKQII